MNYPFKTICCIISSPCHLCNLEYDKVELRIGTKNNRNYSKRKSMIYRDLTPKYSDSSQPYIFILFLKRRLIPPNQALFAFCRNHDLPSAN